MGVILGHRTSVRLVGQIESGIGLRHHGPLLLMLHTLAEIVVVQVYDLGSVIDIIGWIMQDPHSHIRHISGCGIKMINYINTVRTDSYGVFWLVLRIDLDRGRINTGFLEMLLEISQIIRTFMRRKWFLYFILSYVLFIWGIITIYFIVYLHQILNQRSMDD